MSSTNRGRERNKDDLYETPEWMTEAILPELSRRLSHVKGPPRVFEPAAGKGRMVRVIDQYFKAPCDASDINDDPSLDFLALHPRSVYDLIITNPPFMLAMEFVQQALKFRRSPDSVVALLLRVNFLGSKKRAPWLREFIPAVYVSPKRPSFSPDGRTDSPEYGWFLWQEPFKQTSEIGILHTENVVGQRRVVVPTP
jgi:hypothetical protein